MKKKVILIILVILIIGTVFALYRYISFTNHFVSSDAVFVKSDSLTNLSFKLPGKIEKIYVNEGDKIKKGEILAKLDTKDLEIQKKEINFSINALNNSINSLILQKQKLANDINYNIDLINNEFNKLQKNIKAFEFNIDVLKVKLAKAKKDYNRFSRLYKQRKISKEKLENIQTAYFALNDEIKSNEEKLKAIKLEKNTLNIKKNLILNEKNDIKKLQKIILSNKDKLKALKEKLALVNQNITDSYIYAPFSGNVAKKFANSDEVVPAGKMVLSIVNLKNLYVLDLLEEKKLKGIKKGCKVKIHIDALDKNFNGYVSKILPASAATFALLPRDISSGEFTKLQQRFFVRIRFNKLPKDVKVGMSGEATITKCKMEN